MDTSVARVDFIDRSHLSTDLGVVGPKCATRLSVRAWQVNRTGRELLPSYGDAGNLSAEASGFPPRRFRTMRLTPRHKAALISSSPESCMASSSTASAEALLDAKPILGALRALRKGDFAVRLPMDQIGMAGAIAEAFNDIAQQLAESTDELDRISLAVGKEGKIDQRLSLGGATGGWADRVHSVNSLIGDLVEPTLEVARVIGAVAQGDLSQKMTPAIDGRPLRGAFLWISGTVNTMVDQLGSFASEVTRVAREVGTEGKLGGQAEVRGVAGTWKDLTDSVNSMAGNLTGQVRNIADVTKAVANGDLSKKVTVDVKGEILELKNTVNTMVDQLGSFASEVTRVAREVGTEGKLGGQAEVRGVAGTWKDLTDSVNSMAGNLTGQVRNIADVTKAVANGDLSKKVTVDVKGEILELKNTVNTMVDQLGSFASEVTRVAREVGTEGKLGGQAEVRGVAGTWKDLTDNVNIMAGNLTSQVRNIAEVTTAVARGDLSREDHRRRQGRDPRAEEHHQHHGRPARLVRLRGHPGGPRGRHRGPPGREGGGEGRGRDLEGPHRQRQHHGRQPDLPGAEHRRGHDRRRPRGTCRGRSPSTSRARSSS